MSNTAQELLPLFRVITKSKTKNLMMKMFFKILGEKIEQP